MEGGSSPNVEGALSEPDINHFKKKASGNSMRTPSYCDRILFQRIDGKLPTAARATSTTIYDSTYKDHESDHYPVFSFFEYDGLKIAVITWNLWNSAAQTSMKNGVLYDDIEQKSGQTLSAQDIVFFGFQGMFYTLCMWLCVES